MTQQTRGYKEIQAAKLLYALLLESGWQTVPPETLVACPSCRAVVMFTDAAEHAEVAHPHD